MAKYSTQKTKKQALWGTNGERWENLSLKVVPGTGIEPVLLEGSRF